MRIYVDGTEAAKTPYAAKILFPFEKILEIGRHGFGTHDKDYSGLLDEVRFSGKPWSAERMKAEYEIQKPGSTLIRFD